MGAGGRLEPPGVRPGRGETFRMQYEISLPAFHQAEAVVRRFFPPTPALPAPRLSRAVGAQVTLKLDTMTPTRTFKARGALVKLHHLAGAAGVITASAGNHGMSVAYAARVCGRPATVCVPAGANPQKVEAIAALGARVVTAGRDYFEAYQACLEIARAEGLTVVHAYDDPQVIAGQGTLGLELAAAGPFDAVLCGVGGGGLLAGVAGALAQVQPGARVYGVQPEGADSMARSLAAGEIVTLERVDTIADGLGARAPGAWTFALARRYAAGVVRVSDADLMAAMRFLVREERLIAEPAGAAGVAALLRHGAEPFGREICVLVTGANIADAVLAQVLAP